MQLALLDYDGFLFNKILGVNFHFIKEIVAVSISGNLVFARFKNCDDFIVFYCEIMEYS